MDRLTSMHVFVRTADLGSFAAAAEALRISPQMVAKHIARLESRLGTPLINRTTRRQHLTDIGRSYYERCKIVLSEAEAADAIALEMKASPSGTLRVNAPLTAPRRKQRGFPIQRVLPKPPDAIQELQTLQGLTPPDQRLLYFWRR